MRGLRSLLGLLLLVALGCAGGEAASEGFGLIHLDDLVAMLASAGPPTTLLDANGPDFRARHGIIPGANLLSSYGRYDVATELPPAKDARLVFYCADSH